MSVLSWLQGNPGARSRVGQVWNGLLIMDRYRIS